MHMRDRVQAHPLYLIYSATLALFLSVIWTLNLVYQVETVGLSPFQIVLIGTVLELSYFLMEVPTGIVADLYSRRLSVIVGTLILGAGFVLMGAVPSFAVLLLSQVICGIGYTFLSGALEAWIADEIGEAAANNAFIRGSQAETLGTIIGIPIAIGLALWTLAVPIVVGGTATVALGLLLIWLMPERGFTRVPQGDRTTWQSMAGTLHDGVAMVRRRPVLLTILAIAATFGTFNEGWDRLAVPHMLENFSFPDWGWSTTVWIGGLRLVFELLGVGALEIVRRRVDLSNHVQTTRTLLAINASLMLGVLAFALAGGFWFAAATMTAASLCRHIIYPIKTAWINQSLDPRVRATVMSMSGQADAFGQMAGGPAVGGIGSLFGLRWAMAAASAALAPGLLLYGRALRQDSSVLVVATEEESAAT